MTKFNYCNDEDQRIFINSMNYLNWIIFGRLNKGIEDCRNFLKVWQRRVRQVNFYPQGTTTKYINSNTPGICRFEGEDIIIDMLGTKYSNMQQVDWLRHEITHELCHSYADTLPSIYSINPDGVVKNGVLYKNNAGMIEETDAKTGEYVGTHFYGKMFNETTMDIISTIGLVSFDERFKGSGKIADTVLRENYSQWGNVSTGYSMLTSITRLAIAAFSNNAIISYEDMIKKNLSIVTTDIVMKNGEKLKANDFLYGILCDPQHIEKEFDKFMGDGSYRNFVRLLDKIFLTFLKTKKILVDDVKKVMNVLPDFANKKMAFYMRNGIVGDNERRILISNFNYIWNSMMKEYSSYFTQEEIDEIGNRAMQSYNDSQITGNTVSVNCLHNGSVFHFHNNIENEIRSNK